MTQLTLDTPDPVMVAHRYRDENVSLVCALFAYGNARVIVDFLNRLNFEWLDNPPSIDTFAPHYYRFQTAQDTHALFVALWRLRQTASIEAIFLQGYLPHHNVMEGIFALIEAIYDTHEYRSRGYEFLIGKPNTSSTYKRWLMYLRWMVRSDGVDMGLWGGVDTRDLLLPLDTHTFAVARKLGMLQRKSYDLKAVYEVTQFLQKLDYNDPIKYDFALYRMGQQGEV